MINSGKDTDNYMCQSTRAWLDLKQDKTDNLLNTTNKTVVGAINELNTNKQNITDNTLETTSKEIVGAINEIDAGYGNKIDVSIDSSSYVMTVTLKNRQGSPLSSSQIDLPLESVVVNGAYNSETKEVELTLQNGSKISFSVADLVNGIQSEITEQNKLSADLVDDTSTTNKFVTQDILNQISQNTADRHTHANKAILDATTASYTTAEQEKLAGLENYTLPTATSTTLGGVKVGSGLEITLDGILSASSQAQTINLTDYITDGSLNIDFFTTIIQKISAEGSAKYSGTLSNATDLFNKVNTYNSNSLGFNIALTLTDVKIIFTDVMYGISVDSISIVGTCLISMDGSTFVFSLQISGSNTAMEYSLSVINENIIYLTKYATEFNQAYTNHNTVSLPDNSLSELLSSHYYSLFVVPIYTPPATLLLRVAGTHNDSVVLSEVQLVENEGKITSANLNSFLVSSSSVSYGSKSLQFTTSDELTTTSKEIVGAINELKTTTDNLSSSKQNINDNTLTTTDKTVVGAINELKTSKYTKPTEGIGLDDLSSSVQASLSKADTAIQQVKTINGLSIVGEGNLVIGDSGTSLPALPEDAATKTYVLKAVNGVFQWVEEPLTLTEA